ncbi:MAG: NAD(P)-dependent oxidoreductase [Betaproteobacteria bacterium]
MRILIVDPIDPSGEAHLREHAEVTLLDEASLDEIRRAARDADALITRSRVPDDIFEAAPRLRAATIHGTGTDLVPVPSATAHGVAVAHLPGGNSQSVAEYCAMAVLMLARNVSAITTALRTGPWDPARRLGVHAHEIAGMTAGLVGVGGIGGRLARMLRNGFGMKVLGNQRRLDRLPPEAQPADLDQLAAESDFIVISCPLTPQTHHLFNAARLARMKPGAWLINVGRGPVVEEAALVAALREKRIAGAMLDVYEQYRLEPGHPYFALENVVLTPHLAGMTKESRARMGRQAAEDTLRMLAGERPTHFVNPEVWTQFTQRFHERRPENR